jgi:hypothetical protein
MCCDLERPCLPFKYSVPYPSITLVTGHSLAITSCSRNRGWWAVQLLLFKFQSVLNNIKDKSSGLQNFLHCHDRCRAEGTKRTLSDLLPGYGLIQSPRIMNIDLLSFQSNKEHYSKTNTPPLFHALFKPLCLCWLI